MDEMEKLVIKEEQKISTGETQNKLEDILKLLLMAEKPVLFIKEIGKELYIEGIVKEADKILKAISECQLSPYTINQLYSIKHSKSDNEIVNNKKELVNSAASLLCSMEELLKKLYEIESHLADSKEWPMVSPEAHNIKSSICRYKEHLVSKYGKAE